MTPGLLDCAKEHSEFIQSCMGCVGHLGMNMNVVHILSLLHDDSGNFYALTTG